MVATVPPSAWKAARLGVVDLRLELCVDSGLLGRRRMGSSETWGAVAQRSFPPAAQNDPDLALLFSSPKIKIKNWLTVSEREPKQVIDLGAGKGIYERKKRAI